MAEIIILDYARRLQFRDGMLLTNDGKYNQNELINIIKSIAGECTRNMEEMNEISRFVMQCFTINGILETYNNLGLTRWKAMIQQMVDHEVYERNIS